MALLKENDASKRGRRVSLSPHFESAPCWQSLINYELGTAYVSTRMPLPLIGCHMMLATLLEVKRDDLWGCKAITFVVQQLWESRMQKRHMQETLIFVCEIIAFTFSAICFSSSIYSNGSAHEVAAFTVVNVLLLILSLRFILREVVQYSLIYKRTGNIFNVIDFWNLVGMGSNCLILCIVVILFVYPSYHIVTILYVLCSQALM